LIYNMVVTLYHYFNCTITSCKSM